MHNLNTVHGNLTTDTIFLQHQGLIKIGCFSITMMRNYVKTNAEEHNHLKVVIASFYETQFRVLKTFENAEIEPYIGVLQ